MSWYNLIKFIKIAGPKEKIQQFKVTDPALQVFITKYESMIKWNGYPVETLAPNPETGVMEPTGEEVIKKITNQDGINEFIKTQLLPNVYAKTDPNSPNNNYVKKFDLEKEYRIAKENNIFNPQLDQAYNLYQKDKEAGEKSYINFLNDVKKQSFDAWINYFKNNAEHPEYEKSPAFLYLFLSSIINSSNEKQKNPPPVLSAPVIAAVFKKVQNIKFKYVGPITDERIFKEVLRLNRDNKPVEVIAQQTGESVENIQDAIDQNESKNIDIHTAYEKNLADYTTKLNQHIFDEGAGSGWLKIPSKPKTVPRKNKEGKDLTAEQAYEENLEILENFSIPNAWCTTRDWNGRIYLGEGQAGWAGGERIPPGDFWMLIEKGKANVGIRFEGEYIAEIAGSQKPVNGQYRVCPLEYWKEVVDIITKENLVDKIKGYSAIEHWKQLLQQKELNQSFFNEDGTPNIEEIEAFKVELFKNPSLYKRVTNNEKFNVYPEIIQQLKDICKQGWFANIQNMQGLDAMAMAENAEANAQQMPDFVLEDPLFIETIHGRLTVLYENNPERIKDVLERVPNHWQVYPQGKEIFKKAILNKYVSGMYWKANAFGYSRKTKEQKAQIVANKKLLEEIQEIIGKNMPELNEDREFEANLAAVKNESAIQAIEDGYFSQEMPKQYVEDFFLNPEKIEKLSTEYANKISSSKIPASKQETIKVFSNEFMNKELNFIAPGWIRKLEGFQNLVNLTKQKVLLLNIDKFKQFDEEFKQNADLFAAYKKNIIEGNPLKRKLREGDDFVDKRLQEDPEYQNAVGNVDQNLDQVVKAINFKPAVFLTLSPALQEKKEIYEAYLLKRINTNAAVSYSLLSKEFARLPEFLKARPDVREKYINVCIMLLKSALPGSPSYLDCKDIQGFALEDARISELCRKRAEKAEQKIASIGWYMKLGCFVE